MRTPHHNPKETWVCILSTSKRGIRHSPELVSMYSTDTSGKTTGKPREMKCKLDTGASVNVMPLAAYKLINPSEFDKDGKPK